MKKITLRQHGRWLPADIQTPISLYLGFVGDKQGILLESAEVDGRLGRYSLIAWDFRLTVTMSEGKFHAMASDDRLAPVEELNGGEFLESMHVLLDRLEILPPENQGTLPPLSRGIHGNMGYGLGGVFEPKLKKSLPPEEADVCLALPGKVVLFDHLRHRCCLLCLDDGEFPELDQCRVYGRSESPKIGEITVTPGCEDYMKGVALGRELITRGEGIQVVLSTRFSASISGDPFVLYRRLRQINPSPFMFYMNLPGQTLLGSSPELLVRSDNGRIEVRPIAGTRPRGADEEGDAANAADLLADPKERAEHVMLVDLGRNDLGRMATPGSVEVLKFMQVEHFSHVMHLTSYVEADLREGLDAMDVLVCGFPAGTVSGAPKVWAMETIAEIEKVARGPYAGAIGWMGVGPDRRNMDTGIAIRSMWIRDNVCHWQAGAGIVYDSVPENEWKECNNKARVLREVLLGEEDGDVFAD